MDTTQEKPRVYKYRYVNLVIFFITALVNAFAPNVFVAFAQTIRDLYDVPRAVVNFNSLSYTLFHPIVMFPANYILDQIGLKPGLTIACFFMCLGYGLRLMINVHFWIFVLGTCLTSLGFIFMLNSPTKFISNWFPVHQIPIANAIVMFALFASDALATFIPVLFVNENSTKSDVFNLILFETILVCSLHVLMLVLFRGQPPTPPNYASGVKKEKYIESLKKLTKNRNYVLLFLSMMMVWGTISSFFVTISWQMNAYGYQSMQIGLIIIFSNSFGMFGCVISGIVLEKYKQYKKTSIVCLISGIISLIIFVFCLELFNTAVPLYVVSAIIGLFLFPFITTMTELSTETAFPVGEATAGGTLLGGGQFFGFILGLSIQLLFDGHSKGKARIGAAIYMFFMLVGVFFLLFVKQDLRKQKYEEEETEKRKLLKSEESSTIN